MVKTVQEKTNKLCQLCNLNADGYYSKWLYVNDRKNLVELVLETSEWDCHYDGFTTVEMVIEFCPECGRRKEEIIEEWSDKLNEHF